MRLGFYSIEIHVDESGEEDIVTPTLVDERRTGFTSFQHIDDSRQFVDIELDGLSDVFGLGTG